MPPVISTASGKVILANPLRDNSRCLDTQLRKHLNLVPWLEQSFPYDYLDFLLPFGLKILWEQFNSPMQQFQS